MSVKKYMFIDLAMLSFIGFILEAVGTFFVNYMTVGALPMTVVSILITILALVRWNWKGLLVIPFCALGCLVGGQFLLFQYDPDNIYRYDWRVLISVMVGLAALSINLIPFNKFKTNNLLLNYKWFAPIMIVVDCLVFEIVRGLVYSYIVFGDNRYIMINAMGYDATGYIIAFVMGLVLLHQKIMLNFKEKVISEKEQKMRDVMAEKEYYEKGSRDEATEDNKNLN